MTRELLDKLSGGNKAGLLLDVLNQDEVVKVIEHNDFVTIIETNGRNVKKTGEGLKTIGTPKITQFYEPH